MKSYRPFRYVSGIVNFISFFNFTRTKKGGAKVTTTAGPIGEASHHRLISMKNRGWEPDSQDSCYVARVVEGQVEPRVPEYLVPDRHAWKQPRLSVTLAHGSKRTKKIRLEIFQSRRKSYGFLIFNSITRKRDA